MLTERQRRKADEDLEPPYVGVGHPSFDVQDTTEHLSKSDTVGAFAVIPEIEASSSLRK